MATNTPAQQLFDLLVSRDFDPELLDVKGMPATDPAEAELFNFDFRAESGKDYGTVVVLLGNDNNLEVYFGDNVGRTMEGNDKNEWYAFLEQLKHFAVKNFMEFSPKNINRLRYSMQGQAAIKEGLFESWTGTKTQSWNGNQTEARLMIKHKKSLGETDARFRYVESLFVETAEGERYKLPFTKLSGGRAMVEHVRNGGRPYDIRGQHIVQIVEELNILSRFRRANQGRLLEGDTAQLVEDTNAYYATAQKTLKSLSTNRGYTAYFESWNPAEVTEEEVVIEGLKHLFVTQSIDTRIEQALPLLARIQQQGKAMKEANIFEAWAERLLEGTWQLPDTPEKQTDLIELMSIEQPVGADATNITEQLYGLLGDDHLFDQLEELAERDANADARQVIFDRMQELSDHPDVLKVIEQLNIDPTAEMNPPEGTPADLSATPPEPSAQVPGGQGNINRLAESRGTLRALRRAAGLLKENVTLDEDGSTFDHILDTYKRDVKDFEENDEMSQELHDALYDYYFDDMPYGVQKARTGDPYEWVADRFAADLGHPGAGFNSPSDPDEDYGIERESVMHGDYAEEAREPHSVDGGMDNPLIQDEGVLGAVAGTVLAPELGPLAPVIGSAVGDALSSDEEAVDEADIPTFSGEIGAGASQGPTFNGQIGAGAGQGPIFRTDASTGQHVDVSKVVPGEWGSVGNPGYKTAPGTPTFKDMGTATPANPTALPKSTSGGSGGSGADLPKGMLGGSRTPVNEKDSPLSGQYGHSGKMKAVDKDLSFLDRLKELSGLKK